MTGYLAGTLSVHGYLGRHAAWFSVRQLVVALIFIAVLVALLVGPLLLEPLSNLFSKGVKKAAPGGFVLGLAVLLIGLASGVRFITIAGAAVLGAVVLGFIIDNYLTRVAWRGECRRRADSQTVWAGREQSGPRHRAPSDSAEGGVTCGDAALPWRTCRPSSRRAPGRLPGALLHALPEPRSKAALIWTRHKAVITAVTAVVIVAALVAGLLLTLRGDGQARKAAATRPDAPRPDAPRLLLSPFTGKPVASLNRVLIVKIDNIVFARPQTGLSRADIVYVLPVEGGLSRFMAVFSSDFPPVIGPVRSAREDDLELLRQFGRPAFAYSGATATLLPYIHRTARIVDLFDGIASGYFRSSRRIAPYNLYAQTRQLQRQAPQASRAHDIGFRFGPPPRGGRPARSVSASYPAAWFRFTWSAARHGWLVSMDGTPAMTTDAGRLAPATVVIMHTTVRTSRFLEYGKPPPYAESVGSGVALVLRDGKAWTTRWSRPSLDGGTTFTTAFGQRMTFARGQVWIVLAYR